MGASAQEFPIQPLDNGEGDRHLEKTALFPNIYYQSNEPYCESLKLQIQCALLHLTCPFLFYVHTNHTKVQIVSLCCKCLLQNSM